ncbi:coiled-coil domain-containing protein 66 isoform X6 [Phyllostomus hastatus]|uniref:coiled-coil domain-containing protein 66 isoform X6 n=1 Tax=Phyllostomus hastatus TaxID=9423 RepID=UPI001E684149|nr:coiled-coil domain-containing protein 66 isoform X6 [Phyllostomus hastatus]
MNLGDGLKLETELLDGKTKLILSPYECKSKISVKMGNKTKTGKRPFRAKQTGYILKSTQNTCIRNEKLLQKKRISSETSLVKGEKNSMAFSLTKDLCKEYADKDCLHIQKEISPATSNIQKTRNTINTSLVTKQKPCKKYITGENMKSSFVCLTQDQLQQILMTVNQGNRSILLTENGKEEETSQYSLHLNSIPNQPKDENIMGLLQKTEAISHVWDENKSVLNKNQETSKQPEQKIPIESVWKPADIFSTLGERERDRSLLEAKKAQWRKELDEQVALKKKEKEAPEKWNNPWKKSESDIVWENLQILDQSKTFPSVSSILSQSSSQVAVVQADGHSLSRAGQILEKAITAQVEEKRRKKQLQEEQRKKEEQEEELRLAREREEMQKQYEEDILKQKQKEEIITLKTNELFQTMQRAQELAQRLKQEQRIRELAQKGHDTSRLMKNLGVDSVQVEFNESTNNISNSRHSLDEVSGKMNTCISSVNSSKKDTGVQTDNLNIEIFTSAESHCGSVIEREIINCSSPEIPAEFNEQFNTKKNKQELRSQDKGLNLEKENSWYNDHCNQFTSAEKQTKHRKKCPKRPDWNINKPLKGYIPASEKYPKQLQKQREEKKVRRQMELLHLVERKNPGNLSQNRSTSPVHSSHQETESKFRWHLVKKEEECLKINSFNKERSQSPPVSMVKNRTQQTQTLKNNYERENLISGGNQTELSPTISEPSHFIPYVRTNEIYYLDPDAPLSRPLTQNPQYQNPLNCDQEQRQLFDSDYVRDPLLNPNLVKNRDRQQAILKGLSELRQGLLQKQRELETNLMPLAANQEEF